MSPISSLPLEDLTHKQSSFFDGGEVPARANVVIALSYVSCFNLVSTKRPSKMGFAPLMLKRQPKSQGFPAGEWAGGTLMEKT